MKKIVINEEIHGKICSVCNRKFAMGELAVECELCTSFAHEFCYKEHGCGSDHCQNLRKKPEITELVLTKEEVSKVIAVPENTRNPSQYVVDELKKHNEEKLTGISYVVPIVCFICLLATAGLLYADANAKVFYIGITLLNLFSLIWGVSYLANVKNSSLKGISIGILSLVFCCMITVIGIYRISVDINKLNASKSTVNNSSNKENIIKMIDNSEDSIKPALMSNVFIKTGYSLSQALGSGVVLNNINGETYIITNMHVLTGGSMVDSLSDAKKKSNNITVTYYNGLSNKAEIIWVAPKKIDLALIKTKTPIGFNSKVNIGSTKNLKMGQKVFAVGNPMGLEWTYTEGVVSSFRENKHGDRDVKIIQIQTPLNHGNSGGGLYSDNSILVGINTYIYEKASTEGLNFSIAIDEFTELLDKDLLDIINN